MVAAAPPREAVPPVADSRFAARQLPALTGLRFVAALGVVLCHATTEWRTGLISTTSGRSSTWSIEAILAHVLGNGWLGVNLFFILSGFILAYTYTDAAGRWRGTRRAFYVARLARIYPVYLLALLISALPALWHSFALSTPLITIPATLTFTELWLPHPDIAWCGAGWSLAPEAFFYLLFPLLALPCARLSRRQAVWLLGLCWLGTLLVVLGYHGQMHRWLYTSLPLVRLPEFVMGVVAARLFVLNETHAAGGRRVAWMTIAASLGCLGVLATGSAVWPDTWLRTGLWDPVFVLLIVALAQGGGGIARSLSSRMAIILGEASYALFLLHLPLWTVVTHVLHVPMTERVHHPLTALPLLAGYLLGVVGVSILTFHVLEQPARRKIRRALS